VATIKVASFEQITGTAVLTGSADHPVVVLHMVNRKGEVYTREYALRQKTITHAVEYTVKLLASDLVKGLRPKSKKAPITMLLEWWKRPWSGSLSASLVHRPRRLKSRQRSNEKARISRKGYPGLFCWKRGLRVKFAESA